MCQSKECCVERHADRRVVFGSFQSFWDLPYNGGRQEPIMSADGKGRIVVPSSSMDDANWVWLRWANGAD